MELRAALARGSAVDASGRRRGLVVTPCDRADDEARRDREVDSKVRHEAPARGLDSLGLGTQSIAYLLWTTAGSATDS